MDSAIPILPDRRRARGARTSISGRFEALSRVETDDGWDIPEERGTFRTQISEETPRSVISWNRSPDLPFDRSINPYRGCEHGCSYCFARPTHAYLGLSPGLDFETRLVARPNAALVLAAELRARSYKVAPMAIGTNTDPYQPVEARYRITRACLEVLRDFGHPVAVVTKGTLVERDIDILSDMAVRGLARVGVSVTTLNPVLSRRLEPRAPTPARRLDTIRRLSEAGIPVRVMVSPVIPGLTDAEVEAILAEGARAGAQAASWIMLRLPLEVSPLWQDWLAEHYSDRAGKVMRLLRDMHGGKDYDAQWGRRMRGQGPYAELIARRFDLAAKRLGLAGALPPLRCDLFAVPLGDARQPSLF